MTCLSLILHTLEISISSLQNQVALESVRVASDPNIESIDPILRGCLFPHEQPENYTLKAHQKYTQVSKWASIYDFYINFRFFDPLSPLTAKYMWCLSANLGFPTLLSLLFGRHIWKPPKGEYMHLLNLYFSKMWSQI